ncbi:hypothetical protein COOONC_06024 [Cooperia oncophora]
MSDRKDIVEQDSEMCVDHTEDVEDELKIAEEEKQGSSQMDPPSSRPPTTAFVQGVTAQQMPSAAPVLFVPPQMCAPPQVVCPGMQIMQTAMATIRQEINELRKEIKLHRQERKRKRAEKETHISRKKMKGSVDYLVDHFEDCILTANAKPERISRRGSSHLQRRTIHVRQLHRTYATPAQTFRRAIVFFVTSIIGPTHVRGFPL